MCFIINDIKFYRAHLKGWDENFNKGTEIFLKCSFKLVTSSQENERLSCNWRGTN